MRPWLARVFAKSPYKAISYNLVKNFSKVFFSDCGSGDELDSSVQQANRDLNILDAAPEAGTNFVTLPELIALLNVASNLGNLESEI